MVGMDITKFFDHVNHGILMARVSRVVKDKRLLQLIGRFLRVGAILPDGCHVCSEEGTPQGGPLSPLLANILPHNPQSARLPAQFAGDAAGFEGDAEFDEVFFGEIEGFFLAVLDDGKFGGAAAAVVVAPAGLPVFVTAAGLVLGDDVGDAFDAAFFHMAAAAVEGFDPVLGQFFGEGVAVFAGFGERGVFPLVAFVGEKFRLDGPFEGDAHEPAVVAFFGLVDAADAVVGPGKFHAK